MLSRVFRSRRGSPSLADVSGLRRLREFLGSEVLSSGGVLGRVEKIVVDRRSRRAKRVVVEGRDGRKYVIRADRLVVDGRGGLVLDGRRRRGSGGGPESRGSALASRIERIRERLLELDERLIEGEVDLATFRVIRRDLEEELERLLEEGRGLLPELRRMLGEKLEKRGELERDLEKARLEGRDGDSEVLEEEVRKLNSEITKLRWLVEILGEREARETSLEEPELAELFSPASF